MGNRTLTCALLTVAVAVLWPPSPALPWYVATHVKMTRAVAEALPGMPRFLAEKASVVADCSGEPDVARSQKGTALADRESPDHFIDYEYVRGETLPPARFQYDRLVQQKAPGVLVGSLPYAIVEWADRLALAFAEHRRWPDSEAVRMRCLVFAGILCHYCEDLWMPLHTTVNYDGMARDGISPRTGIHDKVDGLVERLGLDMRRLTPSAPADWRPPDDLFAAVVAEIEKSNAEAKRIYALEAKLMAEASDGDVGRLASDCSRRAMLFAGRVLAAAWRASEKVQLPPWLSR